MAIPAPNNKKLHFLEDNKHIPADWGDAEKWKTGLETFAWDPIPPRGKRDMYEPGEIVGPFLNVFDKKGGVEPGFVPYVRDERYEETVSRIIIDRITNGPKDHPIVEFFKSENIGKDKDKVLEAIKNLNNPDYPIEDETQKKIHEIFRAIEKNTGKTLIEELGKLPKDQQLPKFLIKQDYKDPAHHRLRNKVSIGARRGMMTAGAKETASKYGIRAAKIRAELHNWGRLQKKREANKNGFMESMSTRLASSSGMDTQIQGVIRGTYKDPPKSKLLTMTKFAEGFGDFEGRLMGGNVKDGNFAVEMERDTNGKVIGPKRDADGYFHADKSIQGMGENLAAVLRQDDFDFFGSKGGNKGIVNNKFFGIDFGHAYEKDNRIVGSLRDDFSFKQPKKPIKNASVLYDNPLSEKMKGILLLCKLRGREVSPHVIDAYRKTDPEFVKKYEKLEKDSDYKIFEEHQAKAAELEQLDPVGYKGLREEVSERYKRARDADAKILAVFDKRIDLTPQQLDFVDSMEKLCSETTDLSPHAKDKKVSTKEMKRLEKELKKYRDLNEKIQKIPKDQLKGTLSDPKYKDTLASLIKRTEAKLEKEYKKNAIVKTNHLRVNPKTRVACQLTRLGASYDISLTLPKIGKMQKIKNKIQGVDARSIHLEDIKNRIAAMDQDPKVTFIVDANNPNQIHINCSPEKLSELMTTITEPNVKKAKEPFDGFVYANKLGGGAQKKAAATGFYMDENNPDKRFAIKKSDKYPADNIAEVVTSTLLKDVVGEAHAVPYDFVKNKKDGSMYLRSDVRKDFKSLGSQIKKGKGWLGSNPRTLENKQAIDQNFQDPELRKEMATVLAGSLLVGDSDCQVENICFYKDEAGKNHVAKFDDGWGLAELGSAKHKKVDLFEQIGFYGQRGTHQKVTGEGLPTNHYVDYPFILHSPEFVQALQEVSRKADEQLRSGAVGKALDKIDVAYKDDPEARNKAYQDFAAHLQIQLPDSLQANQMKGLITTELRTQLKARAASMEVLSVVMDIKLKTEGDAYRRDPQLAIADLQKLKEVITNRYKEGGRVKDILPNFDNAAKPFKKESVSKLLNNTLELAQQAGLDANGDTAKFCESLTDKDATIAPTVQSENRPVLHRFDKNVQDRPKLLTETPPAVASPKTEINSEATPENKPAKPALK